MKTKLPLIISLAVNFAFGQTTNNYSTVKPAEWVNPRTDTLDYSLGQYQGKNALIMTRKFGN